MEQEERYDPAVNLMSAPSITSLIPSEEKHMMMQEVKDLDEETVKVKRNILKYNSSGLEHHYSLIYYYYIKPEQGKCCRGLLLGSKSCEALIRSP